MHSPHSPAGRSLDRVERRYRSNHSQQFLKTIKRTGLRKGCSDWRTEGWIAGSGFPEPTTLSAGLNSPDAGQLRLRLFTRHAPWAFSIRLPVYSRAQLRRHFLQQLLPRTAFFRWSSRDRTSGAVRWAWHTWGYRLTIDLAAQRVTTPEARPITSMIDWPFAKGLSVSQVGYDGLPQHARRKLRTTRHPNPGCFKT